MALYDQPYYYDDIPAFYDQEVATWVPEFTPFSGEALQGEATEAWGTL